MSAIQEIIDAIACRLGEIYNTESSAFSDLVKQGMRDGKQIYLKDGETFSYNPKSPVFAYHRLGGIKPSVKDPWQRAVFVRPSEASFLAELDFFMFSDGDITEEAMIKALLAFDTDYKTPNASALVLWKNSSFKLHEIIKQEWPESWPNFQGHQATLQAAHIQYQINMKSCKIC